MRAFLTTLIALLLGFLVSGFVSGQTQSPTTQSPSAPKRFSVSESDSNDASSLRILNPHYAETSFEVPTSDQPLTIAFDNVDRQSSSRVTHRVKPAANSLSNQPLNEPSRFEQPVVEHFADKSSDRPAIQVSQQPFINLSDPFENAPRLAKDVLATRPAFKPNYSPARPTAAGTPFTNVIVIDEDAYEYAMAVASPKVEPSQMPTTVEKTMEKPVAIPSPPVAEIQLPIHKAPAMPQPPMLIRSEQAAVSVLERAVELPNIAPMQELVANVPVPAARINSVLDASAQPIELQSLQQVEGQGRYEYWSPATQGPQAVEIDHDQLLDQIRAQKESDETAIVKPANQIQWNEPSPALNPQPLARPARVQTPFRNAGFQPAPAIFRTPSQTYSQQTVHTNSYAEGYIDNSQGSYDSGYDNGYNDNREMSANALYRQQFERPGDFESMQAGYFDGGYGYERFLGGDPTNALIEAGPGDPYGSVGYNRQGARYFTYNDRFPAYGNGRPQSYFNLDGCCDEWAGFCGHKRLEYDCPCNNGLSVIKCQCEDRCAGPNLTRSEQQREFCVGDECSFRTSAERAQTRGCDNQCPRCENQCPKCNGCSGGCNGGCASSGCGCNAGCRLRATTIRGAVRNRVGR